MIDGVLHAAHNLHGAGHGTILLGQLLSLGRSEGQDLGELGASVWAELDTARFDVEVEICYCSVFDDCWRTRYPDAVRTPVARCIRREDQE